ncbi:hypothetical protein [Myxococcus sp. RHSTA-1-4]|uniref:hypothetical protein n=1 Tax=Myxococcus sp. RHSTA-1-4 TaxID=2874601 RepID=UPI001CBDD809|nr:hypothetical protein [Myxococcus sp. RHSTA-1-4]MBZ4421595.1 hypothetical protein [Myxococcus sp. RHSTA-1-4]
MEVELIQIARTFYPPTHSGGIAESPAGLLAHQRWDAAWDRAMDWKECDALIEAVQAAFPSHFAGRFIQPRMVACLYCILVLESSGPGSGRIRTRIVGAISVLAPVYLVYVTTEPVEAARRPARARISFVPQDSERPYASKLARLIEQHLGYRAFPLELADVPLPDIRVDFLHKEQPTLLTALFANRLEDLP